MSDIVYTSITPPYCQPVADLLKTCFPDIPPSQQYLAEDMEEMVEIFAEGTVVAVEGNRVVGIGTGIFVNVDPDNLPPTEAELLDDVDGSLHDVNGSHYFGGALAVHPTYRNRGIARQIYNRRKNLVTRYQKKGFYAAAFLEGYSDHKHYLDIHEYVDKVISGELFDSSLSVQLRNGFSVVKLMHRFFISPKSNNWSALIYWGNPISSSGIE